MEEEDKQIVYVQWNVCGQLRVGFFATKCIKAGEEICVDYRLECYGYAKRNASRLNG